MITVKKFTSLQRAELYAAALRNQGIPAVVNNALLSMLLPAGEISLSVPKSQIDNALNIIRELEINEDLKAEEDFTEADLEDIYYEKELHIRKGRKINKGILVLLLIIITVLLILTFTNNTSFLSY